MESLKNLSETTAPDIRQKSFTALDLKTGGMRPFALEDFHRSAESIQLHAGVPEAIRSHFETARNLLIYSWFYYPFHVTAQLSAYITVEFALRIKLGDRKSAFRNLLKKAVDTGLVTDNGFPTAVRKNAAMREYNQILPPELQVPEPKILREYSDTLTRTIPFLRNEIAHGTTMLHNHGAKSVRIAAELINQLFTPPQNTKAAS